VRQTAWSKRRAATTATRPFATGTRSLGDCDPQDRHGDDRPVKRQLKQEFGFTTPGATDPYQSPTDGRRETEMVTGDLNAALVEWVVQYRISDPVKFLFEVREPSATLRYVSESVMREVVGDRTVDEVITIGRQEIESEALLKMQALATKYAMGISIDQVQLKNINPPSPCRPRSTRSTRRSRKRSGSSTRHAENTTRSSRWPRAKRTSASAKPTATG
jgi:regulator of protease activity HflC (stomatin/prohibitin superfamily)